MNHETPDEVDVDLPPCPKCGGKLRIEWRWRSTGYAMVAGMTTKYAATDTPHLVCVACGFVQAGKRR